MGVQSCLQLTLLLYDPVSLFYPHSPLISSGPVRDLGIARRAYLIFLVPLRALLLVPPLLAFPSPAHVRSFLFLDHCLQSWLVVCVIVQPIASHMNYDQP